MLEFLEGIFGSYYAYLASNSLPYHRVHFQFAGGVGSRPGLRGHWLCAPRLFYHAWINMESPLVVSSSESSRGTSFHGHADCS